MKRLNRSMAQLWAPLLGSCLWLMCHVSHAGLNTKPSDHFPIEPYEATYVVSWHGIRGGESKHRFVEKANGEYHISTITAPYLTFLPLKYIEQTDFTWKSGQVVPDYYSYNLKEGRRHKVGTVVFDRKNNQVYNRISKEPWQQTMPEDVQDKLTHAVQLRIDLMNGKKDNLTYTVAEDDEIKPYTFELGGTEKVRTNLGIVHAQKVIHHHPHRKDRKTIMWLSMDHDYLPIRVEHYREGDVAGSGMIKSYRPTRS